MLYSFLVEFAENMVFQVILGLNYQVVSLMWDTRFFLGRSPQICFVVLVARSACKGSRADPCSLNKSLLAL